MKLSSSPSVSSSTSTSTFTGIFPTTKGSVSGCLSFVLRTILCSTKLPTHPSDRLKEITPIEHSMKPRKPDDSVAPNLVARLMGLDSMPELPSIARSKSMNSADCRAGETGEVQGQHRRVKTTVSFDLEDDDFFVISFENEGQSRKSGSRKAKADTGGRGTEQRRRRKEQGRRPRFKISEEESTEVLVLEIENCDRTKKERDRRRKKDKSLEGPKFETESESENSSPVSVLDHSSFIIDHEAPTSEDDVRNRSSSPRRKLVSELSNLGSPSSEPNNEACPKGNAQSPSEATKVKQAGPRRKRCRNHRKTEMLSQVGRLAITDMADSEWTSNGGIMRNLKIWEAEIGVELGLQIVDQLVDEMVDELI